MKVNGEAIYGTTASPFPYNTTYGYFTQRPGKLFLHLIDWPAKPLTVYGIKNKIAKAYLLADSAKKPLKIKQTSDAKLDMYSTTVELPAAPPDKYDSVVAFEVRGKTDVVSSLTQQPDHSLFLEPYTGKLQKSADSQMMIDPNGVIRRWVNKADSVAWDAKLFHPGTYDVVLSTTLVRMFRRPPAAAPGAPPAARRPMTPPPPLWEGGHKVTLDVGGVTVSGTVAEDGRFVDPSNPLMTYVTSKIGQVKIAKGGPAHIVLKADSLETGKDVGLTLANVKLVPAK